MLIRLPGPECYLSFVISVPVHSNDQTFRILKYIYQVCPPVQMLPPVTVNVFAVFHGPELGLRLNVVAAATVAAA